MEIRNLTCIGCPLGCALKVELEAPSGACAPIGDTKEPVVIKSVSGNTCKRGDAYARKEVTHPTRTVTSTVRVLGGDIAMVSVKTEQDIPKEKIMDIMASIADVRVDAPVKIGDVILADAAGTGVNVVATKDVARCLTN